MGASPKGTETNEPTLQELKKRIDAQDKLIDELLSNNIYIAEQVDKLKRAFARIGGIIATINGTDVLK